MAGTSMRHAEEPQGSPLSAMLFVLRLELLAVREGLHEHQAPNLADADDLPHFVGGKTWRGQQQLGQLDNASEQSWTGDETKQVHSLETARPCKQRTCDPRHQSRHWIGCAGEQ